MWAEPRPETLDRLRELYLRSEELLEERGETPRHG
jgi:cobaltochelatase CobN